MVSVSTRLLWCLLKRLRQRPEIYRPFLQEVDPKLLQELEDWWAKTEKDLRIRRSFFFRKIRKAKSASK